MRVKRVEGNIGQGGHLSLAQAIIDTLGSIEYSIEYWHLLVSSPRLNASSFFICKIPKNKVSMVLLWIMECYGLIQEDTKPNTSFWSIHVFLQNLQHILECFAMTTTPCWSNLQELHPPPCPCAPVTWLHGSTLQGVGECSSVCCAICVENESIMCSAIN